MTNKEKVFIGIISWFPEGEHRGERIRRCRKLIDSSRELFGVPIVVIAQNWRDEIAGEDIIRLCYPKLGITAARKTLWDYFRSSSYDWMICFDDDCALEGTKEDGRRLIDFLRPLVGGYLIGRENEFKLCAFHRSVADSLDIPDLDVDSGSGIEDYAFFRILECEHPEKRLSFDWRTLRDASRWQGDETSCWPRRGIAELLRKTNEYINKVKR